MISLLCLPPCFCHAVRGALVCFCCHDNTNSLSLFCPRTFEVSVRAAGAMTFFLNFLLNAPLLFLSKKPNCRSLNHPRGKPFFPAGFPLVLLVPRLVPRVAFSLRGMLPFALWSALLTTHTPSQPASFLLLTPVLSLSLTSTRQTLMMGKLPSCKNLLP
jgi:hypothetical protein